MGAPMSALVGKVAIVTGAGRGIGRGHALRFATEGCKVVVNDIGASLDGEGRDDRVADAVVEQIRAAGGDAIASHHDVSQADEVERLVQSALDAYGRLDIMLSNAAIIYLGSSVLETTEERWKRTLAFNLDSAYHCTRVAARHMVETQTRGRVLLTMSPVALEGNPGVFEYACSKAAVFAMGRSAAMALRKHQITVNMLSPIAYTRITRVMPIFDGMPEAEEVFSPDNIARVAVFLASDEASEITGTAVEIQGRQLSVYEISRTAGIAPNRGPRWTLDELKQRWRELSLG